MLITEYSDIDYDFRPESYGVATTALAEILRNVKGTMRRKLIEKKWRSGRLDEIEDELLEAGLSDESVQKLGRLSPFWMGGEYLPDYLPGEEEIARLEYDSLLKDVTSIRARFVGGRYHYRVVDEHETEFNLAQKTSRRPFSLRGLIRFIDHSHHPLGSEFGLVFGTLLDDDGTPFSPNSRYLIGVSSDYYPDLWKHYDRHFAKIFEEGINIVTGAALRLP